MIIDFLNVEFDCCRNIMVLETFVIIIIIEVFDVTWLSINLFVNEILNCRHLMGDALSTLTVKELKQLENRLERGITRIRSKKVRLN